MNTTVKRLITLFTFLCMLLLIVFSVELFMLNRSEDVPVLPSVQPPVQDLPIFQATLTDIPSVDQATPTDINSPSSGEDEPVGIRYEFALVSDVTLIIYVDDELFELEDLEQTWIFKHIDGVTKFEISPVYLPQGPAVYANNFLDGYLGGEPYGIRGQRPIGNSPLSGVYARGTSGDDVVSGWVSAIDTVDGDNMGMVIVTIHRDNDGETAILAALDTLEMLSDSYTTPEDMDEYPDDEFVFDDE